MQGLQCVETHSVVAKTSIESENCFRNTKPPKSQRHNCHTFFRKFISVVGKLTRRGARVAKPNRKMGDKNQLGCIYQRLAENEMNRLLCWRTVQRRRWTCK
ncbi:hypothetical protein XENORESO_005497 [Xenotaenia resolanae]|uniref:Uncharacterized protein n=1 Tax=Xenotaenia resolanae TaxID=208358 RepID=A0ABV0VRW0_9TELE